MQQRLETASDRLTFVLSPRRSCWQKRRASDRLAGREAEVTTVIRQWLSKNGL
jgi:hypothetical protein